MKKSLGLFEKSKSGLLVPSHKVIAPVPKGKNSKGAINDVSKRVMDDVYETLKHHYEMKEGKSLDENPAQKRKFREMAEKSAERLVNKYKHD